MADKLVVAVLVGISGTAILPVEALVGILIGMGFLATHLISTHDTTRINVPPRQVRRVIRRDEGGEHRRHIVDLDAGDQIHIHENVQTGEIIQAHVKFRDGTRDLITSALARLLLDHIPE